MVSQAPWEALVRPHSLFQMRLELDLLLDLVPDEMELDLLLQAQGSGRPIGFFVDM